MDYDHVRRTLDEYFPRRKVTRTFHYKQGGFNIIGFSESDVKEYKHCPLDPGIRLIMIKGELK